MFMDITRFDDNVDIRVLKSDGNKASIMLGHNGYLSLSMAELRTLKYEIDAMLHVDDVDGEFLAHAEDGTLADLVHGATAGGTQ